MRLPEEIEVTVLARDEAFRAESDRQVKFIPTSTPDIDVVEEAKVGYDLIIVGSPRTSAGVYESDAIKESSVPVLVVYSEKTPRSSNSTDDSHDHEVFEIGTDV